MSKHNFQIQSFAGAFLKESVEGNFENIHQILLTIPKSEQKHLLVHLCILIYELFEKFGRHDSKIMNYLDKIQSEIK